MRSISAIALALPLLVGAQQTIYPWDNDPNYVPPGGWGTPAGGWGNVNYKDSTNNNNNNNNNVGSSAQPAGPSQVASALNPYGGGPSQPASVENGYGQGASPTGASPNQPLATGGGGTPGASSCASGQQSIEIQNNSGKDLIIGAGPPWSAGACSTISNGKPCTVCLDRGTTGGNLELGFGTASSRGTWIEGNWDVNAAYPCLDISYIPGYSVPVVCTNSNGATIGLATPLCTDASCSNCASGGGTYIAGSCQNPRGDSTDTGVNGPTPPFFSRAEGIVYTYPNDSHDGYAPGWDKVKCVAGPQSSSGGTSYQKREEVGAPVTQEEHQKRDALAEEAQVAGQEAPHLEKREAMLRSEPEQQTAHGHSAHRLGKRMHSHGHVGVVKD